ncbi:MAG: aminotransferase class III-fold pyridoxal phosphate-dependent enzyme, partial [Alphaproteobacteria bacterium]
ALMGLTSVEQHFDRIGQEFIHHVSAANMYAKPEHMSEAEYCDYLVDEFEQRIHQLGPDNVAAFIAEPIMGAGGVLVAPQWYHRRMWEVCKRYDMLYIADEVVTAFGRLGHWFASEEVFDYQPDILVSAKGITSGYIPLGATLISDEIYDVISKSQAAGGIFSMGLTYFGHPVACRAALKNIEIMDRENLCGNAADVGAYFQSTAQSLMNAPLVGDVRGKGLMLAVDLVGDKQKKSALPLETDAGDRVFRKCLERGVIVRPVGDRLVLSPPLIINREQVDTIVAALSEAVTELHAEL